MKKSLALVLVAGSFLVGCAGTPQLPIAMKAEALAPPSNKVGVAMSALPKVDTQFPGASCLLCLAAAALTNSTLTSYTQTLQHEDLPKLKDMVADALRKKGATATLIADELKIRDLPDFSGSGPNIARKDFTGFKAKYNIDKLVIIDIGSIGINRAYSSYFPVGEPKAEVHGQAALINLSTNTYEWYAPLKQIKSAENNTWDEPPKFPGLTNAYFQVLEMTKDSIVNPIAN